MIEEKIKYMICRGTDELCEGCPDNKVHELNLSCSRRCTRSLPYITCSPATKLEIVMARLVGDI